MYKYSGYLKYHIDYYFLINKYTEILSYRKRADSMSNLQEPTKNTNYPCLNNFNDSEISIKFYSTDEISSICDKCQNLTYSSGMMTCNKLQ